MALPRSRAAAKALQSKRYFTGKPCCRGHVAERLTSTGQCIPCVRQQVKQWYHRNAERLAPSNRERANKWYKNNKERASKTNAAYREKHKKRLALAQRKYQKKNAKKKNEHNRRWYKANLEKAREFGRRSYHKHKKARRAYNKWYSRTYAGKVNARTATRRALKANATPAWLTHNEKAAIAALYKEARRRTETTGTAHQVDHIIPLRGTDKHRNHIVCGLHILINLRIVPRQQNLRKNSYLIHEL